MNIRSAQAEDAAALAEIYQVYVYRGLITFDETPPDAAAMRAKIDTVQQAGLPFLVVESAERVRGYAYATPYRDRRAYRYTLEDAIYLASDARGQGYGKALLAALISAAESGGYRQMIAAIAGSEDAQASRHLHASLGFEAVGRLTEVGFKKNQWIDVELWQRRLEGVEPQATPV